MDISKQERIAKAMEFIKGEFDSVVIIATGHTEQGITEFYSEQAGNEYAIEGSVQSWLSGDFIMEDF